MKCISGADKKAMPAGSATSFGFNRFAVVEYGCISVDWLSVLLDELIDLVIN